MLINNYVQERTSDPFLQQNSAEILKGNSLSRAAFLIDGGEKLRVKELLDKIIKTMAIYLLEDTDMTEKQKEESTKMVCQAVMQSFNTFKVLKVNCVISNVENIQYNSQLLELVLEKVESWKEKREEANGDSLEDSLNESEEEQDQLVKDAETVSYLFLYWAQEHVSNCIESFSVYSSDYFSQLSVMIDTLNKLNLFILSNSEKLLDKKGKLKKKYKIEYITCLLFQSLQERKVTKMKILSTLKDGKINLFTKKKKNSLKKIIKKFNLIY